ncbi:helix-turn-helix domain-containing protein [Pedobacter polysacchareus]|uniref:helix-turn-helix domain-containing protein n=1 Tax=Pedobacter polysacchareus TaxID=2861973 RepID=UPI001C9938F3|nr:AraC family transcriptional regulator [Pedobacter polysacchareus]
MKEKPLIFKHVSQLMDALDLPKPQHPLAALVNYDLNKIAEKYAGKHFLIDLYKISFKRSFSGQLKYGQGHYDFEAGGLAFLAPNQLVRMSDDTDQYEGYALYFHPDLIQSYPLAKTILKYGFFSYGVSEALFMSDKEKKVIETLFDAIAIELDRHNDQFSQDILVSQIELLLNHSNRFYNRQFLTRKGIYKGLIELMNDYLQERFNQPGLPSVQEIAAHLKVSPRYLTDLLKSLTGQSTQQHIHDKLIEKAKNILATSNLSIAEIAYTLGFEHPQSFNKLFKKLTDISPGVYRQNFG